MNIPFFNNRFGKGFASHVASSIGLLFLCATSLVFSQELNVLVIGSTHSFSEGGESGVVHEKPFNPAGIATHLQNILAQDGRGTVNFTMLDRYRADAITAIAWTAHSYNLTNRKPNEAPTARNLPARSLWAQILKEYPTLSPMRDKAKWKGEFAI